MARPIYCVCVLLPPAHRSAHQRLVTHSEEVAFNDPPAGTAEQLVLNQHLRRLTRYAGLSAFQRAVQQVRVGRSQGVWGSSGARVDFRVQGGCHAETNLHHWAPATGSALALLPLVVRGGHL